MNFEKKTPVILLCCGSFNPITVGHVKLFEIAREFLESEGSYSVIGGILSPVHDSYGNKGLIQHKHRVAMCKLATHAHRWISTDSWEGEQAEWTPTIDVLRHHNRKIKNLYDPPLSTSRQQQAINQTISTKWAVTMQPGSDGLSNHVSVPVRSTSTGQSGGQRIVPHPMTSYLNTKSRSTSLNLIGAEDALEINEASEPNKTGLVLNKLGENLQKMCCVRPMPFGYQPGMVYGANCDFRKTKVMLLCGSDLLESFLVHGVWKDEDIRELVSDFGIICVPRISQTQQTTLFNPCTVGRTKSRNDTMHEALDYLHSLTLNISGTVILVNDSKSSEISSISSSKCRQSILDGNDNIKSLINPCVLRYIQHHTLYTKRDDAA